ncbi:polymorphic toxin-type HINT domain-containing protein [Micromonospora sp. DT4]|uniref:polymorphic toxin-type HINT domain-containing protein n=1 Tax=Micromonospora sp. DT4 TaxID=3393438 RepID=UPI003CEC57F9
MQEQNYDPVKAEIQILCGGGRLDYTSCLNQYGWQWDCGVAKCPESMMYAGEITVEMVVSEAAVIAVRGLVTAAAARIAARACSFEGATLVLMADGSRKQISEIEVGDQVIASDPETGEQEARKVTRVFVHQDTVIDLALDNGASVGTTEDHPFWSATDRKFERVDELVAGERVLTVEGETLAVSGLRFTASRLTSAYNLEIDGIHTYYVLAGNTPVLVHNTCVPNWSPKSGPTFGHTFSTHGAGAKNTRALTDRARSTGQSQGQWLDDKAAAEFLCGVHVDNAGARSVRIPDGLGQVIMPDGSIVQARAATLVPGANGLYKTAYPILGPQ